MSNDSETINIPDCPICGGSHTYNLAVERSYIGYLLGPGRKKEKPRAVRFTRIFTCPHKNEDFQGVIVLYETSNSRIESVEVIGLKE